MSCRPYLRWAGGKRRLASRLERYLPRSFGAYREPFVGSGAMFFHLAPRRAVLSDANERLVRTHRAVRDDVEAVVRGLAALLPKDRPPTEEEYLGVREQDPDAGTDVDVAVWLIYLNRTNFNGLYRVNKAGRFNVPFGRPAAPVGVGEDELRACSKALGRADLVACDFEEAMRSSCRRDLVYCDPPYDPIDSNPHGFISYTADGFGRADQVRLRDAARSALGNGARVVLSNAITAYVLTLYAGTDFVADAVRVGRSISAKVDGRGAVHEAVLVTSNVPRVARFRARRARADQLALFGAGRAPVGVAA